MIGCGRLKNNLKASLKYISHAEDFFINNRMKSAIIAYLQMHSGIVTNSVLQFILVVSPFKNRKTIEVPFLRYHTTLYLFLLGFPTLGSPRHPFSRYGFHPFWTEIGANTEFHYLHIYTQYSYFTFIQLTQLAVNVNIDQVFRGPVFMLYVLFTRKWL